MSGSIKIISVSKKSVIEIPLEGSIDPSTRLRWSGPSGRPRWSGLKQPRQYQHLRASDLTKAACGVNKAV